MLDAFTANTVRALHPYRETSLIRNSLPLGTYSSICLGPYGGPGGGVVSHEQGTPTDHKPMNPSEKNSGVSPQPSH